jgi:small subunit ribosomal protein S2
MYLEKAAAMAGDVNVGELECPQVDVSEFTGNNTGDVVMTLKTMLECGLHLGHASAKWNPRMAPFIYGIRSGIHIVDLEKSLACLRQACQVLKHLTSTKKDAIVLFFGNSNDKIKRLTYEVAMDSGQYYVNTRWTPGTLTNPHSVLGNQLALHHALGADPTSTTHRPTILVLLSWSDVAVHEAELAHCPTIAIVDTDRDPTVITYPVPGNDDAVAGVELVGRVLGRAAREGKALVGRQVADGDRRIADSADKFAKQALDQWMPSLFH